ncbi:Hypothetical predicted protein [Scomber scombrus]|uniref:Uncharacterized protein n=1 Tax=Scomber scombrus TaxID=13677 RepID=A0AAV1MZW6_SCOSC
MQHSAHWCNRLGKLAESQHTSNVTQPQTEREGPSQDQATHKNELVTSRWSLRTLGDALHEAHG